MPLPEGYRPRRGDVIILRAVVQHNVDPEDDSVHCKLIGHYGGTSIVDLPEVLGLYRRHWNEKDKVVHKSNPKWFGAVLLVIEDHAVIKLHEKADRRDAPGGLRVFHCNELTEQAPPPAEENAAAAPSAEVDSAHIRGEPPLSP